MIIGLILLVTTVASVLKSHKRPFPEVGPIAWSRTCFLILSAFAIFKGVLTGSVDLIVLGASLAVGFVLFGLRDNQALDVRSLSRAVSYFAILSVVVEAIQIGLFFVQGRLPALAYEGSISVRFGSILDDPNGFAILIALLLPVVFTGDVIRGISRPAMVIALIACLVLTQSFTGVISVTIALLLGYFALNWRRPVVFSTIVILAPPALLTLYLFVTGSDVVQSVWLAKNGSIDGHRESLDVLRSMTLTDLSGFGTHTSFIESSYVSLIANVGLPLSIVYVLLGIGAVVRLHRIISRTKMSRDLAIYYSFFYFLIAYLIGSLNMQFIQVFPLDLLYVMGICLSIFSQSIEEDVQVGAPEFSPARPTRTWLLNAERFGR